MKILKKIKSKTREISLKCNLGFYMFLGCFTNKFDEKIVRLREYYDNFYKTSMEFEIKTPVDGNSIAASAIAPFRRALDYQSVGRRLLMVDELPQATYARYEKGIAQSMNQLAMNTEYDVLNQRDIMGSLVGNTYSYLRSWSTFSIPQQIIAEEEVILYDYLLWKKEKLYNEKILDNRIKNVKNIISELEMEN